MSKIKTLLTNGTAGKFRNNQLFSCLLVGKSKYLRIGTSIRPIEEWDLTSYKSYTDTDLDIIKLYKPKFDLVFSHFLIGTDSYIPFEFPENEWECIFDADKLKRIAEADKNNQSTDSPTDDNLEENGIKISTRVSILINGEPVDLNNLTKQQQSVLISLGLI